MDTTNYDDWTLEKLQQEEKKLKKSTTFSNFLIGFLFGVMIYGLVKNGFGLLYIVIPIGLAIAIYRNSKDQQKKLQEVRLALNKLSSN